MFCACLVDIINDRSQLHNLFIGVGLHQNEENIVKVNQSLLILQRQPNTR